MLLGLLTIIWRAALGHTGPCTLWIVQWKILHLFSNTSAKMNFASSDCSATISMSNSLSWLYFLRCRSKKMISKDELVNHFVELLTDINEMGIIHTNLSTSSDFPPM